MPPNKETKQSPEIQIKQAPISEAVKVSSKISEFRDDSGKPYTKDYFENRYRGKEHLIIIAYINSQLAGYLVGYDKFSDGSFYCWIC